MWECSLGQSNIFGQALGLYNPWISSICLFFQAPIVLATLLDLSTRFFSEIWSLYFFSFLFLVTLLFILFSFIIYFIVRSWTHLEIYVLIYMPVCMCKVCSKNLSFISFWTLNCLMTTYWIINPLFSDMDYNMLQILDWWRKKVNFW